MSSNAQRVAFEVLRTLDFTGVSASYVAVGGPYLNPARLVKIDNSTDANMLISFNGVDDHVYLPAVSSVLFDYASDRVGPEDRLEQPVNTVIYVKQEVGAPTSGHIHASIMYASGK